MKKKDNTILALAIAVGVFLLTSGRTSNQVPSSGSIPPPPPPQQPDYYTAFKNWAQAILDIFGDMRELWEPGGPFYNRSPQEQNIIQDLIDKIEREREINNRGQL
jgi:hypothetical protein